MSKEISLGRGMVTLVDDGDYERLNQWKWHATSTGYAARHDGGANRQTIYLHRMLLGAPAGTEVDHINRNKLDNRRTNLRAATHAQNQHNTARYGIGTSQYKGVWWASRKQRWCAQLRSKGRRFSLGSFQDETEAARAYDAAARQIHGEYAYLNFPQEV